MSEMPEDANLTCVKVGQKMVQMVEGPIPEPADGEIIVRTTLTTICGSDLHILDESPLNPAIVPDHMRGLPMGARGSRGCAPYRCWCSSPGRRPARD